MTRRPLVSVIVAARDREALLDRALDSVERQGLEGVEPIVVDDASTDGTARRAEARGVKVLRRAVSGGAAAARNDGLRAARGRFVAMLDSDDYWKPGFLDAALAHFKPGTMVVSTNYDLIDDAGRVSLRRAIRPGRHLDPAARALGMRFMPHHSSSVFKREVFERVGLYDESFNLHCEDADLWYRAIRAYGPAAFKLVDRSLACYRRSRPRLRVPRGRLDRPAALSAFDRARALELASLLVKHARWITGAA